MKNDFSKQFTPILELGLKEANRFNSSCILPEHLVLVAINNKSGYAYRILNQLRVPIDNIASELEEYLSEPHSSVDSTTLFEQQYKISQSGVRHLQLAMSEARKMAAKVIGSEHILLALIHDSRAMDSEILQQIKEQYLNFDISIQAIGGMEMPPQMGPQPPMDEDSDDSSEKLFGDASKSSDKASKGKGKSDTPALDKFGYDMTKAAAEGRLDPVVGRENEIERLAQILSRRKKNNPVLIGEPGVGKSAIVEGLALRINQRKVSRVLFDKRVIGLDLAGMVAGTKYRGQFEERIKTVLDELTKNPDIILFIDEIHTIVGAGGAPGTMDAANILKPALARGEIQCIGATTLDEYRQNIEKDGALERRFQKVMVEPTTPEETLEILKQVKEKYEDHHNVTYTPDALEACVALTERYVSDRNFPDKALDALDEAGSRVHITNITVPEEIEKLEQEVDQLTQDKLNAAKSQDYELAASLRDKVVNKKNELEPAKKEWEKSLD
ncbi:MAG: ATP-dependent Clp protease ATP-binding subunit, partial [Muribaculaceae bacterium]|nr:ATP-dependent Clp protease ATP-binding subunit [Muribaculaceae bacterium]